MKPGKGKAAAGEDAKAAAEYYKLHKQAVEDLAGADESNSPEVSEEELKKYRSGPKFRLGEGAKAYLIKAWFAGSVCFFIFWGLSSYISAWLDLLVAFGIVLGVVTDILTNNVRRCLANEQGANDRFLMFPKKSYFTFIWNILYAMVLLACVDVFYNLINLGILAVMGGGETVPLGVGPILFGLFYAGFDTLFIAMKHLAIQIVRDAMAQVEKYAK